MKPLKEYFYLTERDPRKVLITFLGAFVGIAVTAWAHFEFSDPYLITSFGATAVLVFGAPQAPFSKPQNVFFGHLFSAIVGFLCAVVLGTAWYSIALAVALAIVVMVCTNTIHPPGGATALTMVMNGYASAEYIVRPVMLGVVFLMVVAYVCLKGRKYCDAHPLCGAEADA
ncbi:MAG: HPP family protein [Methanomethylophilus sp.]|jgi:CBS-domain-containing membrane protein